MESGEAVLAELVNDIRACRICRDAPSNGAPLPHEPRPVLRVSTTARLCLCSQAPGTRVHASGVPFTDPSGDRLRQWMGVTPEEFYDVRRIAIVPMGFCFPGLDAHGSDLPPRSECARHWRRQLFEAMPQFELILLVGSYAQRWHLGGRAAKDMTANVRGWKTNLAGNVPVGKADPANVNAGVQAQVGPTFLPLPHPSWRNNGWLKRNSWFEAETIPYLQSEVRRLLA